MRKGKEAVQDVTRNGRWNMKHSDAMTDKREVALTNRT
jgi:hypothetical protein